MPLVITKREAAQISTGQKKVIRRAWRKSRYGRGSKIPLVLEPGEKAPFIIEVIGAIRETVADIDDKRAREEGFRDRADWVSHWKQLYAGTNRTNLDTQVFTLRFRKSDLTHVRRRVVDAPGGPAY